MDNKKQPRVEKYVFEKYVRVCRRCKRFFVTINKTSRVCNKCDPKSDGVTKWDYTGLD